ncbi:MAG: Bug family tripartite tricarboxylate transporter substrate binding protein [Beijerinckiaceae bacterium]
MKLARRGALLSAAAAVSLVWLSGPARADWPERPITVIVPYAAGSTGDAVTRLLGEIAGAQLGQRIVVEARPGGGGNIGAQAVANAEPNGYTLLVGATNNFVINQFVFPNMNYNPATAFAPIMKLVDSPLVFFAHPSVPASDLAGFVAYAKANPGKLNFGSPSVGTAPHLATERFKQIAGIDIVHVPFTGSPPAMQALVSGHIQLYLAAIPVGLGQARAGTAKALAIVSDKRFPSMPDVQTADEAGVKGVFASNWWALAAPKGTPQPILDKLHAAFSSALRDPKLQQRFQELGLVPDGGPTAAFLAGMQAESKVWEETVKMSGVAIKN